MPSTVKPVPPVPARRRRRLAVRHGAAAKPPSPSRVATEVTPESAPLAELDLAMAQYDRGDMDAFVDMEVALTKPYVRP